MFKFICFLSMNKEKINKKLKSTLRLLVLISITFIPQSSCELLEIMVVDCNKCYTNIPEKDYLIVKVTINEENVNVPITVFWGPFENNNISFETSSMISDKKLWLDTDKHFTLRAEYKKNGRTYYVINGAKLTTRKDTESCNEPCYYVTGKDVDLRLKF